MYYQILCLCKLPAVYQVSRTCSLWWNLKLLWLALSQFEVDSNWSNFFCRIKSSKLQYKKLVRILWKNTHFAVFSISFMLTYLKSDKLRDIRHGCRLLLVISASFRMNIMAFLVLCLLLLVHLFLHQQKES